jgi:leukotriene-A4 hydrolase
MHSPLQGATFTLLLLLSGTVTAVEGAIGSTQDQSSYSNVDEVAPSHISFNISVNFEDSSTAGTTTQTFNILEANVTTVYLDVWDGVEVSKAEFQTLEVDGYANFTEVSFEITTPNPNIGNALAVTLPVDMPTGTEFFLRFTYRTNADTTALSWMTPAQTAGKKLPFMYSLCQMNFCRDLAPMMDTPSQKITYDATIIAPSELVVRMSANETGLSILNDTHTVTTFACDIRLPSYLIAIVVGDLKVQSLSSRVNVMSEPALLESAVEEFSELPDALAFVEEVSEVFFPYTILVASHTHVSLLFTVI